ncbi:ketol-acid reductoisomerase [Candidatus Micrarchaeota archaeon]|nr:ketol-acid reductoisomerase [Candidatus Micrarchaeota archaeon]
MSELNVYRTEDVSLETLTGKTIAILGYGIQGSAQAANFRDGGFKIVVGGRPGPSLERAKSDGFQTFSYSEAAKRAHVVCLLVPDAAHGAVFDQIKSELSGKTLVVAGGLSLFSGTIDPAKDYDVVMVAPSGPGRLVRSSFLSLQGMVAAFAVHKDVSGKAKQTALALCRALGFTQMGVLECRVKDEAACDVFGEQALLCGGMAELVKASYQTLVDRGYSKEMAYLGTLYELRGLVDLYYHYGIDGMYERVSEAARFGGMKSGPRIIDDHVRQNMEKVLDDIESGAFMKQFEEESQSGFAWTKKSIEEQKNADINRMGADIRKRFKFLP